MPSRYVYPIFTRVDSFLTSHQAISVNIDIPPTLSSSAAYLNGRTISVEQLLQAGSRFKTIAECVEGYLQVRIRLLFL